MIETQKTATQAMAIQTREIQDIEVQDIDVQETETQVTKALVDDALPVSNLSLWQLLGLTPDATDEEIDNAVHRARSAAQFPAELCKNLSSTLNTKLNSVLNNACKVLSDSLYRGTYRKFGTLSALAHAGYFDDGLQTCWKHEPWGDLNWLCTPLEKIRCRIESVCPEQFSVSKNHNEPGNPLPLESRKLLPDTSRKSPWIVLLTTGSFSPLHRGHLKMMELARERLEAAGRRVAGGYFSLSHDQYVSTKYAGAAALSVTHRLQICHEALAESDWLSVDPWEAREAPVSLNFSDVYRRLQAYLARHLPEHEFEVHYVFGSDNAGFANAFLSDGFGVCVNRNNPSSAQLTKPLDLPLRKDVSSHPRVIWVEPPEDVAGYSSSQVRTGALEQLPDAARVLYESWQRPRLNGKPGSLERTGGPQKNETDSNRSPSAQGSRTKLSKRYLLRDDLDWALQDWGLNAYAHDWFVGQLKTLLEQAFGEVRAPDQAMPMSVEVLSRQKQQSHVSQLRQAGERLISLDAGTCGDVNLRVSRQFRLSDGQIFSRVLEASPGSSPLSQQLKGLSAGQYTLVDDDICSGQTINALRARLEPGVHVARLEALSQWSFADLFGAREPYAFHDIVDARDFVLGARSGGLVVTLPDGALVRVPYLSPYVNLVSRAKLPPSAVPACSFALWKLNLRFFETFAPDMRVDDADEPCQKLLMYLGFKGNTRLSAVCTWHLARTQLPTEAGQSPRAGRRTGR